MKDNEKGRTLIDIPADGNYIEILGHRIDGFESFEAFLEHLKKYAVLEETVKTQKAEIERLTTQRDKAVKDFTEFAQRAYENPFACERCVNSVSNGRGCLWKGEHEDESCLGRHFEYREKTGETK